MQVCSGSLVSEARQYGLLLTLAAQRSRPWFPWITRHPLCLGQIGHAYFEVVGLHVYACAEPTTQRKTNEPNQGQVSQTKARPLLEARKTPKWHPTQAPCF
jgi:hypothetical protein